MRSFAGIFGTLLIFFMGCAGDLTDQENESGVDSGNWRSSELLTNRTYFSLFSDSLRNVRAQNSFIEGDSILREMILNEAYTIQNDELLEILKIYKKDFGISQRSQAFASEEMAVSYLQLSLFDSAETYAETAGSLYKRIKDKEGEARTEMIQAAGLSFNGKFDRAQEHHLKALEIYKQTADSAGIYGVLAEMSANSFNQKLFRKSIEIANRVLRYAESVRDSFLIGDMLNTLGNAYHQIDMDDESATYIHRSIDLRRNLKDDFGLSQAYGGLAVTEMADKNWQEALIWCERAIEISNSLQDYRNLASLYYNTGTCYMELHQPARAEESFRKVIQFSEESGLRDMALTRTYGRLAEILINQNRINEANQLLVNLVKLKDDVYSSEKLKIAQELNAKYESAEKEAKLKKIERENQNAKERRFIIVVSLSLVSTLLLALLILFYQRNRNMKKLMLTEQKLKDEELKLIQRELQYNREQLNDFTHHLVEKNKIIFDLENKLLNDFKVPESRKQVQSSVEGPELSNLLQLRILTEDDWTKFKIYFDKVFPGMIVTLRQRHPDLTPAEERLFLLLKLKSDSKEMSEILGISMESVRKNKYRLKKKLSLKEQMNLEEYIDKF